MWSRLKDKWEKMERGRTYVFQDTTFEDGIDRMRE